MSSTFSANNGDGVTSEFFGNIFSGISEGIGSIASDVLPVWVADQLGLQAKDTTNRDVNPVQPYQTLNPATNQTQNAALDYKPTVTNQGLAGKDVLLIGLAVGVLAFIAGKVL